MAPECGDVITARNDEHLESVCEKEAGHLGAHQGGMAMWTDGEHWGDDDRENA